MPAEETKLLEFNQYGKPSGFSMSAISSFKSIENKHDVYRGRLYEKVL